MTQGVVQRRGVPQAEAVADRFGQEALGSPTELPAVIHSMAKVARVDLPAMGGTTVAALAANRSMIQLLNPAGSNTDLLIKRIWLSTNAAAVLGIRTHDAALTGLLTSLASLVRQEGTSQVAPIGQLRSQQGTSVGSSFAFVTVPANVTLPMEFLVGDGEHFDGAVLQPGRGILVAPNNDNFQITATFKWLERQTA